jgi:hypothetical protein
MPAGRSYSVRYNCAGLAKRLVSVRSCIARRLMLDLHCSFASTQIETAASSIEVFLFGPRMDRIVHLFGQSSGPKTPRRVNAAGLSRKRLLASARCFARGHCSGNDRCSNCKGRRPSRAWGTSADMTSSMGVAT